MEAAEKVKEIEMTVAGLRKLEQYLYTPIQRFRKLRKEIDSSIDFLEKLRCRIERAEKKNFGLEAEIAIAAGAETADLKMLEKFFEEAVKLLDKTTIELKERWGRIQELRAEKETAGQLNKPK